VQLAAHTGQTVASAYPLVMLARAEAILGHEEQCRAHVAAAEALTSRTGARAFDSHCALSLGILELAQGRPERVGAQRAGSVRLDEPSSMVLTSAIQAAADTAEAHIRSDALAEASNALAFLEAQAERFGLRWPRAAAARCRGLLAADEFEAEFVTALELFGDDMPFERARTQLCLGMRRRRVRRRASARTVLHEALAYFEAAGAEPWAEQARAELRASGETPAREAGGSLRSLTPQELQVALIVAKGATNRQVGASLFLSEKTVEFHLSNAHRKLGLRSRGELIRRVEGLP
jgi:DNA-binding CsgD family transcriptional regulator